MRPPSPGSSVGLGVLQGRVPRSLPLDSELFLLTSKFSFVDWFENREFPSISTC